MMKEDETGKPVIDPIARVTSEPRPQAKTDNVPSATPNPLESKWVKFETDPNEWKLIGESRGVKAYERMDGRNPFPESVSFRGEAVIPVPLVKMATVLNEESLQKEWVDSLAEARTLTRFDDLHSIGYNRTDVPWPFQDRDFVFSVDVKLLRDPPTMLVEMKSVEDPKMPPQDGIVRGQIYLSYFYMKQLPGDAGTQMIIEMSVNPMGAIPMWLVRASQKNWPQNTMAKLSALASDSKIPVSQKIIDYFVVTKKKK